MSAVVSLKNEVPQDDFYASKKIRNILHDTTAGRSSELEKILRSGSPKMENFVKKRMFYSQDAEDVVQQVYLEAWSCRKRYACGSSPETWMCGIALNLIRKYFQKSTITPPENIDDIAFKDIDIFYLCSVNPSTRAENEQLLVDALVHVQALPDVMRETLEARLDSDGTYQDTARRLGIPIGTVRSRLSRVRTHLREVTTA